MSPERTAIEPEIGQGEGTNGPLPSVLDKEIARAAVLMAEHEELLGDGRSIGRNVMRRLKEVLLHGESADVVMVKTRQGVEVRLPFLGRNESVSDALVKVSSALQKLIPLERQAHGVKDERTEQAPPLTINIGSFEPGERPEAVVVEAEKPAETDPTTLRQAVAHLDSGSK